MAGLEARCRACRGFGEWYFLHRQPVLTFADANKQLVRGANTRLLFLTDSRGKIFNCAIPLHINFPHETTPACAVEAHMEDLEVAEHV